MQKEICQLMKKVLDKELAACYINQAHRLVGNNCTL